MNKLVRILGKNACEAADFLANTSTENKIKALNLIAENLINRKNDILAANREDVENAQQSAPHMLKRLTLDERIIRAAVDGIKQITALKDPVGEVISEKTLENGLKLKKIRVPMGVVGIIYESRPNVTIDSAVLCLFAGNSVILRGGKEAIRTNKVLTEVMREALKAASFPENCVQLLETTDHESAEELMNARDYLDLLIPRGGKGLISTVVEKSTVPVIETGEGNCHVYVHKNADLDKAVKIVLNSKTSNPAVCNSAEKLLVDEDIAEKFLPVMLPVLENAGVEIRGCDKTRAIYPKAVQATEDDWKTEYLDLIMGVKVVTCINEAVSLINLYGSSHSDAIVTQDAESAAYFQAHVDSAAVYVNASTRFTDGNEFGMGAEIGISTQKLHARGPMGINELTSYKYVITGDGQIRE
ncbi:MAG: glutamate-5-semialdehyde dehydrogenase [Clostridiales bacterium]|nr:glutamate-5-semialdehyde dehydrogenase [Clostridiales bacterium]